jgi:hypothetical protein
MTTLIEEYIAVACLVVPILTTRWAYYKYRKTYNAYVALWNAARAYRNVTVMENELGPLAIQEGNELDELFWKKI